MTMLRNLLTALIFTGLLQAASADEQLEKGKAIYNGIGACTACHGAEGAGDGAAAAALNPKPRSFVAGDFKFDTDGDGEAGTAADMKNIMANGAVKYGGSVLMAARPDIKGEDLDALIAYVQSLKAE